MNSRQKSRRSLLGTSVVLPGLSVVRAADLRSPLSQGQRQQLVLETRREAAQAEFSGNPPVHVTNLDEDRHPDRRGQFFEDASSDDLRRAQSKAGNNP